jgi:preprotein translocase subunit YajC
MFATLFRLAAIALCTLVCVAAAAGQSPGSPPKEGAPAGQEAAPEKGQEEKKPAPNQEQSFEQILVNIAPIVLIIAVFWFLLIRPARMRDKQHRETLNMLKKNDKVLTNAGIIGTVQSIKETGDEVTLKLEEGRMRVLKSSIAKILGPEEAAKDPKQEAGKNT